MLGAGAKSFWFIPFIVVEVWLSSFQKGTTVEKLTEEVVRDDQHLRHLIGTCEAQRQVGETFLNDKSSRSHQIIKLIGPDMLISGFLQPVPDLTPAIPSVIETSAVDPTVSPYESNIIFFYKTWDLYGAFSNFSPHPIQVPDGNGDYSTWPSVEHYYQAQKFVGVTDPVARDYMEDIKSAKSAEEAARLARKIQRQHPHLIQRTKLLNDIGFKNTVTLDDTLAVLKVWRGSQTPFRTRFLSYIGWVTIIMAEKPIIKLFKISEEFVVDAIDKGNMSRLINHSAWINSPMDDLSYTLDIFGDQSF